MTVLIFITIIITHWVADFIFQAEEWALGKSKALEPLIKHTATYSALWFIPTYAMYGDIISSMYFVSVTFMLHTATDYVTSRIVSKKFDKGHLGSKIPNFGAFSIIGFDQVLHYLQLIGLWYMVYGIN